MSKKQTKKKGNIFSLIKTETLSSSRPGLFTKAGISPSFTHKGALLIFESEMKRLKIAGKDVWLFSRTGRNKLVMCYQCRQLQ